MFGASPIKSPQKIALLLIPDFSMMAFTSSVEPLRAANRESGHEHYRWATLSADGGEVTASNGVVVRPSGSVHDEFSADVLFVCAGLRASRFEDERTFGRLRELAHSGMAMGGVCTGPLLLARAQLLKGYRCTIHWENVSAFLESYPQLNITATMYEIDRDRYTCSGGTAPLDMMIYSISLDHGQDLAIRVSEMMLHHVTRHPHDTQRLSVRYRTGISNPKLLGAIAHMEAYLENPVAIPEIAEASGLSKRQLERLFREKLGKTPSRYYLELRLGRARLLLRQTEMPILHVAVASGFRSASYFARCYREYFGHAPKEERLALERTRKENLVSE